MDRWDYLRAILEADKESFEIQAQGYETKATLTIDPQEAKNLKGLATVLALHVSVISHYLEVMADIDSKVEATNDGVSEPN